MFKVRVIPCLDVKDGRVVKGVNFVDLRDAGDPVEAAIAYDAAGADELCFLDITASHENRGTMLDVVRRTAEACFMPLTVGGGVRTIDDIRTLLRSGADKVSINSAAVARREFVNTTRARSSKAEAACWESSSSSSRRSAPVRARASRTSRPVARSRAGSPRSRIALRRYRGSRLVGSVRGRRPSDRQNASVSARRTSSSGRTQGPENGRDAGGAGSAGAARASASGRSRPDRRGCAPAISVPPISRSTAVPAARRCSRPTPPPSAASGAVVRLAWVERQAMPLGEPAHVLGILPAESGRRPVVVVEDLDPDAEQAPQPDQRLEQAHGVRTTGDRDEHAVARGRTGRARGRWPSTR